MACLGKPSTGAGRAGASQREGRKGSRGAQARVARLARWCPLKRLRLFGLRPLQFPLNSSLTHCTAVDIVTPPSPADQTSSSLAVVLQLLSPATVPLLVE